MRFSVSCTAAFHQAEKVIIISLNRVASVVCTVSIPNLLQCSRQENIKVSDIKKITYFFSVSSTNSLVFFCAELLTNGLLW